MQRGAVLSQASTLVSDKSADTIQARSVFPHHAGAPDFFKRIKHPPLIRWSGLYLITLLSGAVSLYGQPASRVLDPTNALTQFIHESWQTDDGLPQSTVSSIVQTKEGYIWFGTQEGLVRFDGIEFTVFDDGNEPEFRSNNIRALLVDRNGALWIGTNDAGLVKYREGRFQAVSGDSLFAQARVSALVESENGHLWIGTSDDGLFRLQQGMLHRENRVPSQEINSLVEDESGVLWIGTRDRGLIA
jgi:ligand-binding sensor domain-containing protein